jgi:hypothetical protein
VRERHLGFLQGYFARRKSWPRKKSATNSSEPMVRN